MPRKTMAQRKRALHVKRGRARLNAYNSSKSEDNLTRVTDVIADVLHMIPEEDWSYALGHGVWHAYEEIHGWGTAEPVHVDYDIIRPAKQEAA